MERFKNYGTVKLIIMALSFVGALSMMIMIFRFSSQTGKESGNKSGAITDEIIDIVVKEPEKLDKNTYDIFDFSCFFRFVCVKRRNTPTFCCRKRR